MWKKLANWLRDYVTSTSGIATLSAIAAGGVLRLGYNVSPTTVAAVMTPILTFGFGHSRGETAHAKVVGAAVAAGVPVGEDGHPVRLDKSGRPFKAD